MLIEYVPKIFGTAFSKCFTQVWLAWRQAEPFCLIADWLSLLPSSAWPKLYLRAFSWAKSNLKSSLTQQRGLLSPHTTLPSSSDSHLTRQMTLCRVRLPQFSTLMSDLDSHQLSKGFLSRCSTKSLLSCYSTNSVGTAESDSHSDMYTAMRLSVRTTKSDSTSSARFCWAYPELLCIQHKDSPLGLSTAQWLSIRSAVSGSPHRTLWSSVT